MWHLHVDQGSLDVAKLEVLRENRETLEQNILPDRHLSFLRSKGILSEDDCEEIEEKRGRGAQARKLMAILCKAGPRSLEELCKSLMAEGTQLFLVRILNEALETKRQHMFTECLDTNEVDDLPCPGEEGGIPLPSQTLQE